MHIAIYGSDDDFASLKNTIESVPELQYRRFDYHHARNYDKLIELLPEEKIDVMFATMDGAEGMEGVMVARRICPDMKIVWFTNDKGFGAQAQRLECSYFAQKPVNHRLISRVFQQIQVT